MLKQNWLAFLFTALISVAWLRAVDYFAHRGIISPRLSRKIIHIGTGPVFVLCWLLFDNNADARYFAAVIPLLITLQFGLIGMGVIKDQASVDAMSRSGNPAEILRGPLYYGVIFVVITILFWKTSPVGIVALMMLCGGDGMADIVGKRYGRLKLPWSKEKSLAGSAAVFYSGFLLSILVLFIYSLAYPSYAPLTQHIFPVLIIGLAAALVESFPVRDIDNISVPVFAVITGLFLYNGFIY